MVAKAVIYVFKIPASGTLAFVLSVLKDSFVVKIKARVIPMVLMFLVKTMEGGLYVWNKWLDVIWYVPTDNFGKT